MFGPFNTRFQKPVKTKDDLINRIEELKKLGKELKEIPAIDKCRGCKHFIRNCQGGCLSYKVYTNKSSFAMNAECDLDNMKSTDIIQKFIGSNYVLVLKS